MAVLISCFILCVWQFNSVRSGVSLPITSIAYKVPPKNPISLSLSFSTNDDMESKVTRKFEDIQPIKSSLSTHDDEVSKKNVLLLPTLGLISDNDSMLKNLKFSKQTQNIDPNILYKVSPPLQEKVSELRSNINEKCDIPKDPQTKKNNYNIKVISPPAMFNNLPTYLPVSQNIADSKMLSETYKYSTNAPTSLIPYPIRTPTKVGKQESTMPCENVRKTYSNNEDGTNYKILEPREQKNTINIAEYVEQSIRNKGNSEDILVARNVNKTPFLIDTRSNNIFDYNGKQILTNVLDTSYIQNYNPSPTMSDLINMREIIKSPVNTLSNEINDNLSTFNDMKDKEISKYYPMKNIPSKTPSSYVSKETYISDISPIWYKSSSPNLPNISKPQQIFTSNYGTYNLDQGCSSDSIVSYLTSNFAFPLTDISAKNSLPVSLGDLKLSPHITTDASVQLLEESVFVSTDPEVESPTYSANSNVDVPLKDTHNATKKTLPKSPVPYISSVTINYMPSIESSNEIMIFV